MRLQHIRLKNYRAFVREHTIALRPLTLLFGYNSAGKSAVLRSLPLIAESIRSTTGPLALDGHAARGCTFRDIRTRWAPGDRVQFGLDWSDDHASVDVEIANQVLARRQVIETFATRDVTSSGRFEIDMPDESAMDITRYTAGETHGRIVFEGWLPGGTEGFDEPMRDLLARAGARLRTLTESVHWLGALRVQPARYQALVGSRTRMEDDGTGAIDLLARDSFSPHPAVLNATSAWFERATEHVLSVQSQSGPGGSELFHVELRPLDAPAGVHLADTGEGMTQVLPVVVLGAMAIARRLGEDPILAIEQPELHLHPRAHEHVARHLVTAARSACVVVETHSENLLLAVQVAIAQGDIPAEDVIVHWVRGTREGPSFVEAIYFDDKARPSMWPPGVFAEDRELQRRVLELRRPLVRP